MSTAPWREVTSSYIRTNRRKHGRITYGTASREWVLTLACGHHANRYVKVPDGQEPFGERVAKAKPPAKIRCTECLFC